MLTTTLGDLAIGNSADVFACGDEMRNPINLLTVKEVAAMLAISVSTLRELVRAGEIAFIQKGRGSVRQHVSFHPDDVEDYIKRSRTRLHVSTGPKTARMSKYAASSHGLDFAAMRAELIRAREEAKAAKRLAKK